MNPVERWFDRTDAWLAPYADWSSAVFRWGLGVSFLIGGAYKMLEPPVYQAYFAPLFAALWPGGLVPLDAVFVLAGLFEVAFGLLLLVEWHTPTVAALTVPWLAGTNVNFLVAIGQGEPSVDLLALYVALMTMSGGVALQAVRDPAS